MEPESCFAALKEVATRFDLEIVNARNRLTNHRFNSSLELAKFLDEIKELEKEMLSNKVRVESMVQQTATACSRQGKEIQNLRSTLKEAILKAQSHGIAVPEHLFPVAKSLFEPHEVHLLQSFGDTALVVGSPESREPTVQTLDFCPSRKGSKEKKPLQQAKPSSLPSILKQVLRTSDGLTRGPSDTYLSGRLSKLGNRLDDEERDNTLLQINLASNRKVAEALPEHKATPKGAEMMPAPALMLGIKTPEVKESPEWMPRKREVAVTPVLEDFLTVPLKKKGLTVKNAEP